VAPTEFPLRDRSVLLVCSRAKAERLRTGLGSLGGRVVHLPAIELKPLRHPAGLDSALDRLADYDWLLFTSTHGVEFFLARANQREIPLPGPVGPKVCAIGPATAEAVRRAGLAVCRVATDHRAEGVVAALAGAEGGVERLAGLRVLLARAQEGRDYIPRELRAWGACVADVPCYENVLPIPSPEVSKFFLEEMPDLIVFTSPSTIRNFVTLAGDRRGLHLIHKSVIAVIGPVTARALAEYGRTAEILPQENTVASLIEAIAAHFL